MNTKEKPRLHPAGRNGKRKPCAGAKISAPLLLALIIAGLWLTGCSEMNKNDIFEPKPIGTYSPQYDNEPFPPQPQEYFSYEVEDGKAVVTGYLSLEPIISVPDSLGGFPVYAIGERAFFEFPYAVNVTLPQTVREIRASAFSGCMGLKEIRLPSELHRIGNGAFDGCRNLKGNIVLNGITHVGERAFGDCDIKSLIVNGTECYIGDAAFMACPLETANLSGVVHIGAQAFSDCKRLAKVALGSGLREIGSACFYNNIALTSIEIPYGALLCDFAFQNCTALITAKHEGGIESVSTGCFMGCSSLKGFAIPEGVSLIRAYAFADCTALADIEFPISVTAITKSAVSATEWYVKKVQEAAAAGDHIIVGDGALLYWRFQTIPDTDTIAEEAACVVIPSGVKYIGDTFAECNDIYSIALPDTVLSVPERAFYGCKNLRSVKLGENCVSVGESAFAHCVKLEEIDLKNVKSIGSAAFSNCSSLKYVAIPATVEVIYGGAFKLCIYMEGFAVEPSSRSYTSVDGALYDKAMKTLIAFPLQRTGEYIIPDSVLRIELYAFAYCRLSEVTLAGVAQIGEGAFEHSIMLKKARFTEGLEEIGTGAFEGCSLLSEIILPEGVKRVGDRAFRACVNAERIETPSTLNIIGAESFSLLGDKLKSVIIPGGVSELGVEAFAGNRGLIEVTIENGLSCIPVRAFADCAALTAMTIPDSVESIAKGAFTAGKTGEAFPRSMVIYCNAGSYANRYAIQNALKYSAIP